MAQIGNDRWKCLLVEGDIKVSLQKVVIVRDHRMASEFGDGKV